MAGFRIGYSHQQRIRDGMRCVQHFRPGLLDRAPYAVLLVPNLSGARLEHGIAAISAMTAPGGIGGGGFTGQLDDIPARHDLRQAA